MVRLGIFTRLFLGFMAILIPILAVNAYLITHFKDLTDATHYILTTDNLLISHERKMGDSLLTQIRYERKYLILKDDTLYDNFLLSANEFGQHLTRAAALADTPEKKGFLQRVSAAHERYQNLFMDEVEFLRAGKTYPKEKLSGEKQKEVTLIFDEMRRMREYVQSEIEKRLSGLEETTTAYHNMAVTIVVAALLWGIIVAFVITRGIARPISRVIDKTREVSRGVFSGDLRLSSPPEMAELAGAFNSMCERLAEVDRMKSDFFSSMSHELRTPLTCIKVGTSQLLEGTGGSLSEKQERIMAIIAEECDRLIGLVNSLLDLSKMEAGMVNFSFTETDMGPVLQRACELVEPLASAKGLSLSSAVPPDLPRVRIDGERVLQAILNLLGNAVKFTPQGGRVAVTTRRVEGGLEVSVSDTGSGIPEEELPFVFDKFHQASSSQAYQFKGTGLGLAIAKHIVTAHGGRIWAESTAGQGSSFTFSLPSL